MVAFAELADFLTDSANDLSWDVMCIQELTSMGNETFSNTSPWGHKIIVGLHSEGQRRSAIIVHARLVPFLGKSYAVGRHTATDLTWQGMSMHIISAHMTP